MAQWFSKLSVRTILPAASVLPVFVVAVALTVLAYQTGEKTANELAGQSMLQIHAQIESHLDHLMDLPPAINRLNAQYLRQGTIALDDPSRSRDLVFETLRTFPDVSSIVLGSAQGRNMWIIRYPGETTYEYAIKPEPDALMEEYLVQPDGEVGAAPLTSFAFDPTKRPWYRAAVEADGPTWSDVYIWVRGGQGVTLGVSYVEPYRDAAGALLGVINCEITLADISAFLSRLRIGKTGMAFIVERDGNLVANSIGLDCMKDGTHRLPTSEASDSRIAEATGELSRMFGSLAAIDGVHQRRAVVADLPTQVVISPYKNRRNLDWLVVTLVPEDDFLAEVRRSRLHSTIIGLFAVLTALALSVTVAMWVVKPILAVVAHARRVGGGDLNARIDRRDNVEINALCNALNDMAAGLQDRLRLRHALNLAMEVQQSLLPRRMPRIEGLEIAARSKYCDETGGDYYDFLEVSDVGPRAVMVAMGDVMGHGIAAAMLMATARGVLRSRVRTRGSLGELLTHVNEHLVAETNSKRFMTMFLAVIDAETMTMRWATAGHDQPIFYDPRHGLSTHIDEHSGGLPLGVVDSQVYEEFSYAGLTPGLLMLIGTDGLWECKNPAGEQFGKKRVGEAMAALATLPAADIEAGIYQRLQTFCEGRANDDDITYIVIKVTGRSSDDA